MKYLLVTMFLYTNGDVSAVWPNTWHDDEDACQASAEERRNSAFASADLGSRLKSVLSDCIGLTPLEIMIQRDMIPNQMPKVPR